jgi:hypothetical protein
MEKVRLGEITENEKAEQIKVMHSHVEVSRREQLEERRIKREADAEENRVSFSVLSPVWMF